MTGPRARPTSDPGLDPARAAEQVARDSYGRLLSILSARTSDIMSAEDALAEAFTQALRTWPDQGVPDRPEAWLLTTARNRLTDHHRRETRMVITDDVPEPDMKDLTPETDRRLELMFVCAHPAIDRTVHTPLMLQTVLGLEAADIARAFVTSPAAMAQRLVRAKRKIKSSGIPFRLPEDEDRAPRLSAVQEAIYGALSLDWLEGGDALGEEALFLAQLLARLSPKDAETHGLCALICFNLSRRAARIVNGAFVPLADQRTADWDQSLIDLGARHLSLAKDHRMLGRFQLEAAIQAAHAHRKTTGDTDWIGIARLYSGLVQLYPTLGSQTAYAAALAEAVNPQAGLQALRQIPEAQRKTFQPALATEAHLCRQSNPQHAALCYDQAIALTHEAPVRRYLEKCRATLANI